MKKLQIYHLDYAGDKPTGFGLQIQEGDSQPFVAWHFSDKPFQEMSIAEILQNLQELLNAATASCGTS